MRTTRTKNHVVYYTDMWDENVPQADIARFCRWAEETHAKIVWEWSYAHPTDNFPLFDRGYALMRNGQRSSAAYEEFKKLFDIPSDVRVGSDDLRQLYWAMGGKNEPLWHNQFTESKEVDD